MSDYVLIQTKDKGLGQIAVSNSVINAIIRKVVDEDENVFLEETRSIKTAPVVEIKDNSISVMMKVRVKYGKDVASSCQAMQRELKDQLELMVDYHSPEINLSVVGFRFN